VDKLVGLTRRAGAELAGLDEPDPTLIRHLHDLHALRAHYDAGEVVALAREVMLADAAAYGNQFPTYRENPLRETLGAVEGLAADPGYARRYAEFQRLMVYGTNVEYATCIDMARCGNQRRGPMVPASPLLPKAMLRTGSMAPIGAMPTARCVSDCTTAPASGIARARATSSSKHRRSSAGRPRQSSSAASARSNIASRCGRSLSGSAGDSCTQRRKLTIMLTRLLRVCSC
jgi:hypothetical protein